MGSKTIFKWSKQITLCQVEHLIRAGKDPQKAILIFVSATAGYSDGFWHDHKAFGIMISRLLSANQFRYAEELLRRMKDEKCDIKEDLSLSICRAYGRVHRPLDAIRVFRKMKDYQYEPTEKFITIVSILVEENPLKMLIFFFGMAFPFKNMVYLLKLLA